MSEASKEGPRRGLWFNNTETPEGKYPIVLRRDGTPVETPYMVLLVRDPCFEAAMSAYADDAERRGFEPAYVADIRAMVAGAADVRAAIDAERALRPADPDAPRHRRDDPVTLAWARSIHRRGVSP